jgi:AcrR family transcriptional regulator
MTRALEPLAEKAEQILKGALPEFLAHGYARTSMDRIARSAGVSKQTLYSHFADKDQLFTTLIKRVAQEKFSLVWSKPLEGQPDRVLKELSYRLLAEINDEEYLDFIRLLIAESGKRPELAQLFISQIARPAIKRLSEYLSEHRELLLADPEAIARIFVGSLLHFVFTQEMLRGKDIMPLSEERLIENLVGLIVSRTL